MMAQAMEVSRGENLPAESGSNDQYPRQEPMSTAVADPYGSWRRALAGEKQPVYEQEPWVGYFAVQDRSPGVRPAKGNRWPLIACAIMAQADGSLTAERGGKECPVDWIWPYCASRPLSYADYVFWHQNKHWPEKEAAA